VTPDGSPITDTKGRRSYVTSAGAGPSIGKHLLMAYLPPAHAQVGEKLAVEYMRELYPVTVDIVGSTPIFDPDNARIRS
jgi:glycine cleavage system aminomethyltransferase T